MKKLTISDVKTSEILSKEERKMVMGGSQWYRCYYDNTYYDCHDVEKCVSSAPAGATVDCEKLN
jgi:hypothetical protein